MKDFLGFSDDWMHQVTADLLCHPAITCCPCRNVFLIMHSVIHLIYHLGFIFRFDKNYAKILEAD